MISFMSLGRRELLCACFVSVPRRMITMIRCSNTDPPIVFFSVSKLMPLYNAIRSTAIISKCKLI